MKTWKKIALLLIVTVLCGAGYVWYEAEKQQKQREEFQDWVLKHNGVTQEGRLNWVKKLPSFLQNPAEGIYGKTVKTVTIPDRISFIYSGPKDKFKDLSPVVNFKEIEDISVPHTSVTDLSPLSELKGLVILNISHTDVGEIFPLIGLNKLESLKLHKSKVADLSVLGNHPSLKNLLIDDTPVSDVSIVGTIPTLEMLSMGGSKVTDISAVGSLSNLRLLNVESTAVTDLTSLKDVNNLEHLIISRTEIRDLTPLRNLPLIELHAALCEFPDISVLKEIKTLELLDLERSKISLKQLEEIQKALPNCKVKYRERVE